LVKEFPYSENELSLIGIVFSNKAAFAYCYHLPAFAQCDEIILGPQHLK